LTFILSFLILSETLLILLRQTIRKINDGVDMAKEWQELSRLIHDDEVIIERIRLTKNNIAIEGAFELPPLARLAAEDQIFAAAFLRCHGSIKQMEELFGVSYPSIKNRLNRISGQLDFIKIESVQDKSGILSQLERGEITPEQALNLLEGKITKPEQ